MKSLSLHCDVWFLIWFFWGRLIHHFSLLDTDGEAKVVAGRCECVHFLLHVLLIDGIEGTVIRKEQVTNHSFFDLSDGLQTSIPEWDAEGSPPKASVSISKNIKLNSVGARTQPFLTPFDT